MLKRLVGAVLVMGVAAAGLYLGMATRQAVNRRDEVIVPPSSKLADGMSFPEVTLRGEDDQPHSTQSLLGSEGSVVIFMSLGCAPCKQMARAWQAHQSAGKLGGVALFGITDSRLDLIRLFKANNQITFPIYSDSSLVFTTRYGVDEYPLRLLIDAGGTIRHHTYDPSEDIDLAESLRKIGR